MTAQRKPSHDNEVLLLLRNERRSKAMSIQELSKKIGHDPSGISRWEGGTLSPSLDDAYDWASVLGYDIYFVKRE